MIRREALRVCGRAGRGNVKSSPSRISAVISGGAASKAASTSGEFRWAAASRAGSALTLVRIA
jgi:hypothetical protein